MNDKVNDHAWVIDASEWYSICEKLELHRLIWFGKVPNGFPMALDWSYEWLHAWLKDELVCIEIVCSLIGMNCID